MSSEDWNGHKPVRGYPYRLALILTLGGALAHSCDGIVDTVDFTFCAFGVVLLAPFAAMGPLPTMTVCAYMFAAAPDSALDGIDPAEAPTDQRT